MKNRKIKKEKFVTSPDSVFEPAIRKLEDGVLSYDCRQCKHSDLEYDRAKKHIKTHTL